MQRVGLSVGYAALFSVMGAVVGTFGLGCGTSETKDDPALLIGRVWVDKKPEKPTDYIQALYLLNRPSIGVFQRASGYDFHFERVDYKRDGQTLAMTFPQTSRQESITFTVTACNALPPYDLCLDVSANPWGGPKRYFAKRQQDDEDERAARAIRSRIDDQ